VGLEQGVERDRAGRGADPVADQRSERDRWHADGGQDGVHGSAQAPRPPALDALSEREREVVALVAEGLTNHEIAERLFVSPLTAKTHVSRAMVKLGARDRIQLVVFAYQSGLVRPGWA
jgi:DNA-binding NarL/FixJ family response regulator